MASASVSFSFDRNILQVRIANDNQTAYQSGEIIHGELVFDINEPVVLREFLLKYTMTEQVNFQLESDADKSCNNLCITLPYKTRNIVRKQSTHNQRIYFTQKHIHFTAPITMIDFVEFGVEITPGHYTFPFSLAIEKPASLYFRPDGRFFKASIRHRLKVRLLEAQPSLRQQAMSSGRREVETAIDLNVKSGKSELKSKSDEKFNFIVHFPTPSESNFLSRFMRFASFCRNRSSNNAVSSLEDSSKHPFFVTLNKKSFICGERISGSIQIPQSKIPISTMKITLQQYCTITAHDQTTSHSITILTLKLKLKNTADICHFELEPIPMKTSPTSVLSSLLKLHHQLLFHLDGNAATNSISIRIL